MISRSAMWAITIRHARLYRRDFNLLLSGFYWPVLDIVIWGFLGLWIQQSATTQFQNYEIIALLGILLWQVVGRGSTIIGFAFSEELWSNNLVNLFSLPLAIKEWVGGVLLLYFIMMCLTSFVCIVFIFLLYNVSMFELISTFLIFAPPLLFSGIWIGFTLLQIVVTLGKRGTELGFAVVWFLLPFSGAYYPVEVLPPWGQTLNACLPMSYVFRGMRNYLMYQQDPTSDLIKGYLLGIFCAIIAILLFAYCFNRSRKQGLARLMD